MPEYRIEWTQTKYEIVKKPGDPFTFEAKDEEEAMKIAKEKLHMIRIREQFQSATLNSLKRVENPENCIFLDLNQEIDDHDKGSGGIPYTTNNVTVSHHQHGDITLYPEDIIHHAETNFKDLFPETPKVITNVSGEVFEAIRKKAAELKAKGFTS